MPESETTAATDTATAIGAVPGVPECPPPVPGLGEPSPGSLAYSLTLPAGPASPSVAQEIAELVLDVHEVERLIDPALEVVRELVTYACRFSGEGADVHLALRQREDTLRVTVYDTHAAHPQPRLAALCAERRRSALTRTPVVVSAHRGAWGFRAAECPGAGTWTWATLVDTDRSRAA
ncbi:ATP-binding protein [Streptomyces sp. NPDC059142]|uniref:ATP-binding protein n=1 Tax=Streptomyces sp. NPDC059142 TaxID=3346739 RepID=UPI00369A4416